MDPERIFTEIVFAVFRYCTNNLKYNTVKDCKNNSLFRSKDSSGATLNLIQIESQQFNHSINYNFGIKLAFIIF